MSPGSVVIPAHNEAPVILRTLAPLQPLLDAGVEIIVSTNGCSDNTAELARSVSGVIVLETTVPSKVAALNAADDRATEFPRLYVDADISISPDTVLAVLQRLGDGEVLAARPPFRYDTSGCDALVRAYYRARARMAAMAEHMWGAGVYGLSEEGHRRLGRFPDLTADDLLIDSLFAPAEKAVVAADAVIVRCPRTSRSLLRVLRRVYRGNREQPVGEVDPQRAGGLRVLFGSVGGPRSFGDAVVYAGFALLGRIGRDNAGRGWERDDSTRDAGPHDGRGSNP